MKKHSKTDRPWHPIEAAIVTHVARYGIATGAALFAAGMKGVQDTKQASDRLSALVRRGDLVRHLLPTGDDGFTLSPVGSEKTKRLGFESPIEVQTPDSLMRAYALMSVCCHQDEQKKLLTPAELTKIFPGLEQRSQQASYYLVREAGQVKLGFVRIDRGGRGRWDRIAHKACDDMRKHLSIHSLHPLIARSQFEICVVTALPSKAARIAELLKAKQPLLHVPFRVIAIPNLINFIRPLPD